MNTRTKAEAGPVASHAAARRSPREAPEPDAASEIVELSIVMPCLNEADTLSICIENAGRVLNDNSISGEVIVADNGSSDGSVEIAQSLGARVVLAADKGYGNALMAGIAAARGQYIVIGDADNSYDFLQIARFLEVLRGGAE